MEANFVQCIKQLDINPEFKIENLLQSTWIFSHSRITCGEKWPPTLSFSMVEKWTFSSFFATSSNAFLSLRSLFVSRFRMSKASLMCLFTSSKASKPGKSFSELRFDDILIQVSQTKRQVPKSFFFPRSPRYFFYSQNPISWKFMGVSISSCINYLENVN